MICVLCIGAKVSHTKLKIGLFQKKSKQGRGGGVEGMEYPGVLRKNDVEIAGVN